ncbi:MAG: ABC transporter permease [Acidobacteriaceae bacterium]|nr:ABC transporter permease [Acidobacteriaceae bacterium]
MSWLSRLWNAVNPRQSDEDVAEEMRDHLERRIAGLKEAGLSAEEAERQARLWYGNTTRLREESRDFRLWTALEGTLQDIRYAWRGMRRGPAFVITAVLSLALAIGATTAIYSIVDAAILRPLPVFKPDELFTLSWPDVHDPGSPAGRERTSFSYPEYLRFAAVAKPAARLGLFSFPNRVDAQGPSAQSAIEKVNRAFVSGEAFDLLGVSPAVGRLFSAEEDRVPPPHPVAVLSYEYWQKRFHSDPSVVGRSLTIEGKRYEIAGVARQGFFGVEPGKFIDVWLPATSYEERALAAPDWHWLQIIGRSAPGISPLRLAAMLQPSFHEFQFNAVKQYPTMPAAIRDQFLKSAIHVRSAASGVSSFRETFSRPLWIVFGVAAGILLIACANVASILLARSTARSSEMAMRVSLGAARMRLVRQMLTESLLLSLMAGGLGWLFAWTLAPLLVRSISPADDPVQLVLAIHTRVLFFCIGVSTLSAVLFGLAPAWQASGTKPMTLVRSSFGQLSKLRVGKFCVSIQVACAFFLVMTGAAFLFSLGNLLRVNPGFDARNVDVLEITTEAPKSDDPVAWIATHPGEEARLRNLTLQLQSQMASQPGIQGAALAMWPIFEGGGWSEQVIIPGKGPSEREEILYRVSPGYFATLRTPLIAGRDFEVKDSGARGLIPAIVNEAFARRYFNDLNVVGREFSIGKSVHRVVIVGVAADAHYYDLRTSADPIVYLPTEGSNSFTLYVRSPLNFGQVVRMLDRETQALGSGMRVRGITTLETIVGNTLTREKLLAGVGGACAFLGLLLAAIGLFGLLSYSAGRRTKEIGIRAALGARRTEIISLILKEASGLITGGLVIGLAGAVAAITLFRSLLFGIRAADPFVIGTAIGIFLATGLTAVWLPAYRAAKLDPMSALRQE